MFNKFKNTTKSILDSKELDILVEIIKKESKKELENILKNNQEVKLKSSVMTDKVENIFSTKSFLTLIVFTLSLLFTQIDNALLDEKIDRTEWTTIFVTILGTVSTTLARALEKDTSVYSPHGLPGLNKEDYSTDINNELKKHINL